MQSSGVPTQNLVPCFAHLLGRRLARMRPAGEALVARVIALIIGRHGGGIVVAPHQPGALALLLDVPADELGAARGNDPRILVAIACRHQRGGRLAHGPIVGGSPQRVAVQRHQLPDTVRARLRCRTARPSRDYPSGARSRRCRTPTTAADAGAAPALAEPRGAGSDSRSRHTRFPPASRSAAIHRRIPATCRGYRAGRSRTGSADRDSRCGRARHRRAHGSECRASPCAARYAAGGGSARVPHRRQGGSCWCAG